MKNPMDFEKRVDGKTEDKKMKPACELSGQDGNIFGLVGIAAETLRRAGLADQANEMTDKVFAAGSYDAALGIIAEYVEVQ